MIRARAIDVLGLIGDPATQGRLLTLTDDKSPQIRAHVALALGRIGGDDSLEPLLAAARDPHPLVQSQALAGLALCPGIADDPRAVEPVLALFEDPKYSRKDDVARVLGVLKDRRAVEPLGRALKQPDQTLGWSICGALQRIGGKRAEELIAAHAKRTGQAEMSLFGARAGPKTVQALVAALDSPDKRTRSSAVSSLSNLRAKAAVEPLIKALKDPKRFESHERSMIADALGRIGSRAGRGHRSRRGQSATGSRGRANVRRISRPPPAGRANSPTLWNRSVRIAMSSQLPREGSNQARARQGWLIVTFATTPRRGSLLTTSRYCCRLSSANLPRTNDPPSAEPTSPCEGNLVAPPGTVPVW